MFKLTKVELAFYALFYMTLALITYDGRLYEIADRSIFFFVLITALLISSSAVGFFASTKERNRISFFLLSIFFSPMFMGLIVAIMPKPNPKS